MTSTQLRERYAAEVAKLRQLVAAADKLATESKNSKPLNA